MEYDARWGRYRINISKEDVKKKHEVLLLELIRLAHEKAI